MERDDLVGVECAAYVMVFSRVEDDRMELAHMREPRLRWAKDALCAVSS